MKQHKPIMARVALCVAMCAGMTHSANALNKNIPTRSSPYLTTKGPTAPPLGLQVFCLAQPPHCHDSETYNVDLDESMSKTLNSVNRKVNRTIESKHDQGDIWSINVRSGDCEDYVLTKRAELIKRGVSAGALRIAIAYTKSGQGHAVLVVRTNLGDFVLDNRKQTIVEWHKTDLKWISMSGTSLTNWSKI